MTVQDARIAEFCEQLKLIRLTSEWPGLAQDAAKSEASFADFLEKLLECEMFGRDERRGATLTRLATMPSMETLEQFDWSHAPVAPKAQVLELAHLAFLRAPRTLCCSDPAAWARPTSHSRLHIARCSPATRFASPTAADLMLQFSIANLKVASKSIFTEAA